MTLLFHKLISFVVYHTAVSSLIFTICTHGCLPSSESVKLVKLSDDSTLEGIIL